MATIHARPVRASVVLAVAVGCLGLLLAVRPDRLGVEAGPASGVVTCAAWAAWAIVGYLLVGVVVAAASRARGSVLRTTGWAACFTPVVVRRAVDAAVGVTVTTVAVSLAAPAMASAAPGPPPAPPQAPAGRALPETLDWPGIPVMSRPRPVVVAPGDSLWAIAARSLPAGSSAADVAASWPRWYAANHAVIGADPDLVQPGQRLMPPPPEPRSPR
jgi:hypothetical protein